MYFEEVKDDKNSLMLLNCDIVAENWNNGAKIEDLY
jgi:hypothetical protein